MLKAFGYAAGGCLVVLFGLWFYGTFVMSQAESDRIDNRRMVGERCEQRYQDAAPGPAKTRAREQCDNIKAAAR